MSGWGDGVMLPMSYSPHLLGLLPLSALILAHLLVDTSVTFAPTAAL